MPQKTCDIIDRYILEERSAAENESGVINQNLFINIKKGSDFGQPLAYRNYLKILKRCAKRAGLDSDKIRTHSGRSTKVMEYIEHQIKHPEDGITDAILMECFGWKNIDSIQPYKNPSGFFAIFVTSDSVSYLRQNHMFLYPKYRFRSA